MQKRSLTIIVIALLCALVTAFALVGCGKVDFKLNFIVDGEVCATISTNGEESIKLPANPEKDGYIFDGWYWDNEIWKKPFTANSLLDTPLSSDMSVYAKSMPITYNIEYELNGGENNSANPTTYTIKSEEIVLQTPSKTGYDFAGWYADEELTEKAEKISTGSSGDKKFYAKWIESFFKYTISGEIIGLYVDYETVTELDIPEAINGTTIRGIFDSAFSSCSELKSVTIPKGVISIGRSAFSGCIRLETIYYKGDLENWCEISGLYNIMLMSPTLYIDGKKVEGELVIPDSVTSIGNSAFRGCAKLTSVTIPDSVMSIGDWAFSGCYRLVEVINNSSLNITKDSSANGYVGYYALNIKNGGTTDIINKNRYLFYTYDSTTYLLGHVGNDTDLILPDNYNGKKYRIHDYAFNGCSELTSVTIGNSVTSIGAYAFYGCTGLTRVTIPDSVTSIGNLAFYGCAGLTSVTIGNSVTKIGDRAFSGCTGLTSVTIGNSVKSIGVEAFYGCAGLTSVTIPDSVTSIGSSAFSGCKELTSVTIGNSVTSIGSCAFYGCAGLTSVTIGNSVASIGDWAFLNCTRLTSVTIPDSVTSIGSQAFYNCTGLKTIYYKGTKEQWNNIGKDYAWDHYTGNYTIVYNA